jgi:hypothetical protein
MEKIYLGTFLSKPSPDALAALAVLRKLSEGERAAVCKTVLGEYLAGINHLGRPGKSPPWCGFFKGKRDEYDFFTMPSDDHTQLFKRNDKLTLVSQPYVVDLNNMREIVERCDEHGFGMRVHGGSWYNPGSTFVIEYTHAEPKSA